MQNRKGTVLRETFAAPPFSPGMTFASALFFLGFTLLIALGVVALGLVFAASAFALIAAGLDIYRASARVGRWARRWWHGFSDTGQAFVWAWGGFALCLVLGAVSVLAPRPLVGCDAAFDGFDLLGIALAVPAVIQVAGRLTRS